MFVHIGPGNNEEGFPAWAIIVIIIVILALLGSPIVILLILRIRKKRKEKTGSLEHVYAEKDSETEFGQTISNEDTTADVVWKKNGKLVISYHSERTKFKILRASTEDEGIYSCTFGSNSMQLRYSLIVFGTEEIVYVQIGSKKDFGRTIPDEIATAYVMWKKDGKNVTSTHFERTKFKIVKASSEDAGLYVCTFGQNKMQLKFSLIVIIRYYGTLEKVYVKKESKKKFGKTISDKNAIANAEWTKNGEKVNSTYSDRTNFKIDKASVEDEGLYVCTFGSDHMQLKYSLIVVDEIIYVQNGDRIELGKDIQDEHISHSQWTHNGEMVTSHEIDGTKIQIQNASKSDAGLYVCTFEPNTMQLKYQLIVDVIAIIQPTLCALIFVGFSMSKSKKSKSNLPGGRLTPVENTTYKGRSTLDHKPYGEPLPPLTSIPSNQAKKDE
ncbi:unnamed protein product [Mytilus coruscus]|uniref:Ig-like domain-containing protein n=1 Tax=Mytilus coruscus TaxID=42192 RepID=A0A6J8C6A8_MYTCO|nr:unnamed protein product [Mytilus coruscus]